MDIRQITDEKYREQWNKVAQHPMQAWEWGEFRVRTGLTIARYGIFEKDKLATTIQVTIHPIPHTPWTIGYYPKGTELTEGVTSTLTRIAKQYNCVYIKCEPKVELLTIESRRAERFLALGYRPGRPMFTKYNFVLDVTPSEEKLLMQMKQKTRYNIRVAEKKGVIVAIDNSPKAFERYLQLTRETTERQGFYAHGDNYHRKMWETLSQRNGGKQNTLEAHLLTAKYNGEIITTWVLFQFGNTLYYPYGASTRENREVMANNLVMWEAIKLAKKAKLHYLDMWGALGPEADPQDPWYGFHTFKLGYGARQVEYMGTWDYVAQPTLYLIYRLAEKIRWWVLRKIKH